ncbi:P-loop ATPase, Sll1717 family [Burkholderia glumae]|uniref:P-loop ATPase, Sll1717 family n=1 Tax=Burkholderia glumae TaxID=337 RepID=UPI001463D561|nr:hypothetical protein [Burkholderia glumae]NVE21973.1 hypothetical protein [Burkholderia glumae]QJP71290.1 hypothetical protein HJC54_13525 [Burkholderia glumae]
MLMKEVLRDLDLGNSVAEFDKSLEKYFVENEAFHSLINGKKDIVAGDKGTGKTALYRILQNRYGSIPELKGIEVIAGFNPAGNPVFQRLVREPILSEGQYISVWKAYIFSLIGNWLLGIAGEDYSDNFKFLAATLEETDLRSKDDTAENIFRKITNIIQLFFKPKSAEIEFTFSESGIPILTPRLKFFESDRKGHAKEVPHEDALRLLDKCLGEFGYSVWLALDRLDEAFQGFPDIEIPALRALLRTYLDLLEFSNFRLKLFVRRDLFRRIIGNGFVNLTHINSRKVEITWDEQDLLNLLCRRIRDNKNVIKIISEKDLSDEGLFYKIFPTKVDAAERKPTTLNWIMARIRDGNDIKPPRNLIDLTQMAREEQVRADGRTAREFNGDPLITSEAIKKALERLSARRVEDTLLAEAGAETAALIRKFRRAKAEQNLDSLGDVLGLSGDDLTSAIRSLVEVGFLEEIKSSWKVPMLYRDGLEITQGKAFQAAAMEIDDEYE